MSDAAQRQAYACSRCAGSGRMSQFSNVVGGECFRCRGTGKQYTRPRAPTPKWAVFGQRQKTEEWLRLYNVVARSKPAAIAKAQAVWAKASTDWKNTYTLATARALKWTEMTSLDALSWNEAFKPKEKS